MKKYSLSERILERQREERERRKREREKRIREESRKKRELEKMGIRTEELSLEEVDEIYAKKKEQLVNALMIERNLPESKRELLERQSLLSLYIGFEKMQEEQERKRREDLERRKKKIGKTVKTIDDLFK